MWDNRSRAATLSDAGGFGADGGQVQRAAGGADRGLGGGVGQRGHRRPCRRRSRRGRRGARWWSWWRSCGGLSVRGSLSGWAGSCRGGRRSRAATVLRGRCRRGRPGARAAGRATTAPVVGAVRWRRASTATRSGSWRPEVERGGHPREDRVGGHGAVQQQRTDQRPGPGPVAERRAGRCPRTPGASAVNAPLARAAASAVAPASAPGLRTQDLQVVIQQQVLGALVQAARVLGHDPAVGVDDDGARAEPGLDPASGQPGGHRVVGLAHADPRLGVDPARQRRRHVEHPGW